MKTLVIVTHPNLRASKVNKKFVEESEKYEIRKLYELYPNEKIAVDEEQKAIEQFVKLFFSFLYIGIIVRHFLKNGLMKY